MCEGLLSKIGHLLDMHETLNYVDKTDAIKDESNLKEIRKSLHPDFEKDENIWYF